jgi:hypothetical protein
VVEEVAQDAVNVDAQTAFFQRIDDVGREPRNLAGGTDVNSKERRHTEGIDG